jgi:purine-binding chemotaxis protein CheW
LIVLDEGESDERFGLVVDGVGGVVMIEPDSLIPNPSTLDARGLSLFDGAYALETGLMVRLDPKRLRPSRLKQSGMFGEIWPRQMVEARCAR